MPTVCFLHYAIALNECKNVLAMAYVTTLSSKTVGSVESYPSLILVSGRAGWQDDDEDIFDMDT